MITIQINTLIKIILVGFTMVSLGHIWGVIESLNTLNVQKGSFFIRDMFYFGHEKSISALFSAGLFILLSVFFKAIGNEIGSNKKKWMFMCYLAVFLACDEWFAIHDATLNIYGIGLLGVPYWVWVYGTATAILGIVMLPFIQSLPRLLKYGLIASGLIYVAGSGLMEVVTYSYMDTHSLAQNIGWFFEDALEMVGIICMIFIASHWLKKNGQTSIRIHQWATIMIVSVGMADLIVSYWLQIK